MLRYHIEKFSHLRESSPQIIYCSGWLTDSESRSCRITLEDCSSGGSQMDMLRTSRPDVEKIFRNKDEKCGFELEILSNEPENLKLCFSNGRENISIAVTDLRADMGCLKLTSRVKFFAFLRKIRLFFAYLFCLPLRGLKLVKNYLFKWSPGFQKFYFRYIYPRLRPELSSSLPHEEKEKKRNSSWGEHILLVSHFADGSGAPVLALNIAGVLHSFGFNLHIVLMRDGELHDSFAQFGSVDVINSVEALRTKLQEWENEKIHIRKAFLNTTLPGIFAGLLKESGMTVINLVHEMPGTVTVMGQHEAASTLGKYADKIVLPSTLIRELWQENNMPLPEERCVIMPQPDYHSDLAPLKDEAEKKACHAALCRELGIPEESTVVIGCGMLEPRKAPDVFFQTAFEVCEQNPKVHFVWIGDSGDPFYRKKINLMLEKCPGNTRMLSYRKLNDYYRGADIFFLPSKEDPFPTVGLLAAKVAIPIVFCQRSTGLRDLFGGIEGCSSPEYSNDVFQKIIVRLAADRKFAAQQGACFRKIYLEKMYSFRHYVQSLYELAGEKLARITAIVPNYNYANFLPARVKSIADQTFPIYELLILDDCSKDNSAEVAEQLIRQYEGVFPGGIRYVPNTQNAGVFRQWYKGVSLAKGDLIWIAEADDMCLENMQSQLVHAFRDPGVQIAYAQSALMDGNDEIYAETFLQHTFHISRTKWLHDYLCDGKSEIETALAIKNTIPNASGALFRKTAFSQVPEELFSFKVIGDWFAYLHMIQKGKIAFCAVPLNLYRRHPGSVVAKNPDLLLEELNRMREILCRQFTLSNYTKCQLQREINQTCLMLKASLKDQLPVNDPFAEEQLTEYWLLPDDTDWELFKQTIAQSKASCLFICFKNPEAALPSDVAESFKGTIHLFWQADFGNSDFAEKFTLWEEKQHCSRQRSANKV